MHECKLCTRVCDCGWPIIITSWPQGCWTSHRVVHAPPSAAKGHTHVFTSPTPHRWCSIAVANLLTRTITLPVMIMSQQATSRMAVGGLPGAACSLLSGMHC